MSLVNDDHEEFRNAVRRFTQEEIEPIASELDAKNAEIPTEIIQKMGSWYSYEEEKIGQTTSACYWI